MNYLKLIIGVLFLSFTMGVYADNQAEEAKTNIDYMYQKVAKKISLLLKERPEFLPFGAGMDVNGDVQFIWTNKTVQYTVKGAMLIIRNALNANAKAGRLLGTVIVYRYAKDANSPPQVTAELEYFNGYAVARAVEIVDNQGELTVGRASEKKMEARVYTDKVVKELKKRKQK